MTLRSPLRTPARLFAGAALFALTGVAGLIPAVQAQPPAADVTPLALGSTIPMADVKLKNVDGKDITLAGVKGKKGTLVVFTCNACPWAKAWETRIVELGNSWASKGVGVVAINPNDPAVNGEDGYDVMKTRAKQRGMKFPYAVDATSDLARAFGATRTPEVFVFDAEGKLVYHGAVDDNGREPEKVSERYLADALTAVSTGKEIAVAETKAMGCTIKFRKKAS
jgi:peroxiredoxin